jgi:hypothetical protein
MNPSASSAAAWLCAALAISSIAVAHPADEADAGQGPGAPDFFLAQAGPPNRTATPVGVAPKNEVSITIEGSQRVIRSNGWPDHAPGVFPRRGNPNTATPQNYTFRMTLKPVAAAAPTQRGGWFFAVALNGVPFEPGTGETWGNDPRWRYEAHTGFLDLGLDEHNAHVQPTGAYHYHALPTGLVARLGGDGRKMLLVGWAADGFPLYTAFAPADPLNAASPLRKLKSSYRLKTGPRPAQTGGPGGNYDGRFTQDWEFAKGTGDLDECNGRFGVTPEFPAGTYYYAITDEFPFLPRLWRGTPDASFSKGDRPPPGGGAFAGPGDGRPLPPLIRALDTNGDGEIDAQEIAAASASLRKLDRNGDGKLSGDEIHPPGGPGMGGPPPGEFGSPARPR